jgi:hypothetical protein
MLIKTLKMVLMKIWKPTYWRTLLTATCLITFIATSISVHAQKVPFEVRNFLVKFEKVLDLSQLDTNANPPCNKFSSSEAAEFIEFFDIINDGNILIYNDLVQQDSVSRYIKVAEYVKKVEELYPFGLTVFISDTRIVDVKEFSTFSLYVVDVQKTMWIDHMCENPPASKFHSPVKLTYYIIRRNANKDIKIIGIEASGSAINNKTMYSKLYPDRVEFNAHFNSFNLNFKDIPEQYAGIETDGKQNRFGALLGWDLNGHKNFRFGLSTGLFYDKTVFSTNLSNYEDKPINAKDKDSYDYQKLVSGTDIKQKNERSQLTVPVLLDLTWELPSKWGERYAKRSLTKDLAYKRGININFRVGPQFQYHLSGSNDPYTGKFSYSGLYKFYNPIIQDSSSIIINDLIEYGFTDDTSFSTTNSNFSYKKFNFGVASQLNVSFPIYKSLELYVGPSLVYDLSGIAKNEEAYVLSSQIGENNALVKSSKTQSVSVGINAGLILNLHAPRIPYSTINLPEKAKTQYKSRITYTGDKSTLNKITLSLNLINESQSARTKNIKVNYQINADWLKKAVSGNFSRYKTYLLKYSYPNQAMNSQYYKGSLIIHKPFAYDIKCNDTIAFNSVNEPTLEIPLENINRLIENYQALDLTVSQLPDFNFIYISTKYKLESVEQRKLLVNIVKQIGNEALYHQEELLVYLSSERNRPITFANFLSGNLPGYIYTNWSSFTNDLERVLNSVDMLYEDEIYNIDTLLNPIVNLDERANAERRHVDYYFIVNDSEKYYEYDPDQISEIRSIIYFLSNKFCSNIPYKSDQYEFYVYLTQRYKNERRTPSDININIDHLIK